MSSFRTGRQPTSLPDVQDIKFSGWIGSLCRLTKPYNRLRTLLLSKSYDRFYLAQFLKRNVAINVMSRCRNLPRRILLLAYTP